MNIPPTPPHFPHGRMRVRCCVLSLLCVLVAACGGGTRGDMGSMAYTSIPQSPVQMPATSPVQMPATSISEEGTHAGEEFVSGPVSGQVSRQVAVPDFPQPHRLTRPLKNSANGSIPRSTHTAWMSLFQQTEQKSCSRTIRA